MLNIVLFGPPGAGKGTQSEKVLKKYNLVHLSTGDLFRLHLNNETALGLEAKKYMNKGDLVPDEIVISMVEDKINKSSNVFKKKLGNYTRYNSCIHTIFSFSRF